jgi:hypothetical protein
VLILSKHPPTLECYELIFFLHRASFARFWRFRRNFENRLTNVTLPGTGGMVSFKYDPFGRRIYKSSSGGTTVFAYDGDNPIEETNSSGGVVARYSQRLSIDEPLAMLRSSATNIYQADGLGFALAKSRLARCGNTRRCVRREHVVDPAQVA